jgi:hypothetical protein
VQPPRGGVPQQQAREFRPLGGGQLVVELRLDQCFEP